MDIIFDLGNVLIAWDLHAGFADDFATEAELQAYLDRVGFAASLLCAVHCAALPALLALAERAADPSPQRADEPYRRALIGIYARLAATHQTLGDAPAPRRPAVEAEPYPGPDAFEADLKILRELQADGRLSNAELAQRVGLSATQKPIDAVARFLVGAGHVDADNRADCRIIEALSPLGEPA